MFEITSILAEQSSDESNASAEQANDRADSSAIWFDLVSVATADPETLADAMLAEGLVF